MRSVDLPSRPRYCEANWLQAAQIAHAQDVPIAGPSRQSILYSQNHASPAGASTGPKRPEKSLDKFANYSTAAQLGLVGQETAPSSYEVEQMVRGRDTKAGDWEEVVNEPTGLDSTNTGRNGLQAEEDEEGEGWKFQHKGKRPVRDPYDDDDFDPSAIVKMRKRVKSEGQPDQTTPLPAVNEPIPGAALDRKAWNGTLDLKGGTSPTKPDGLVYQAGGGWVKMEERSDLPANNEDKKPDIGSANHNGEDPGSEGGVALEGKPDKAALETDVKPLLDAEQATPEQPSAPDASSVETPSGGLFKKRRPPPSSRKK